ncbi:MAG: chromophore lyase CpcT/CpeT [Pseudomonadota bacterium]
MAAVAALAMLAACAVRAEDGASYIDELADLSVGSFTTAAQSARDDRYGVAEAEIVRIWPDRDDGLWLYQEQAYLGDQPGAVDLAMKNRPYFARVVRSVETAPGVVRRTVHKLKRPDAAVGAWRDAAPLANFGPDDLEPSECAIVAERVADGFWRSESEKCPNTYKDADYALSISVATRDRYANWDRGFTNGGTHVWGPRSGGYIFVRKEGAGD